MQGHLCAERSWRRWPCPFVLAGLGPAISVGQGTLTEDEIVRPEEVSEGPGPDTVHGAGLQVH